MSDEPSPLSSLEGIDLSEAFAPAWAKSGGSTEPPRMPRERREKEGDATHRRERRPEGRHRDRQDRRPPRRGEKKGRDRREEPKEPRGPAPIEGWKVQFLPDRAGVEGLAKQIKSTARAYPLFDLAHLVLDRSERYLVEFRRTSDTAPDLFHAKTDDTLWTSEQEAIAHVLATDLDKYYRREVHSVEPPKGNYPFVAQCGMSGLLLGPPNLHDYQSKLIRLHRERFPGVPFEVFKSRIRMLRDEESIEKWKAQESTREVYYPIDPTEKQAEPEQPVTPAEPEPPVEPAGESAEEPVTEQEPMVEVVEETPESPVEEAPENAGAEPAATVDESSAPAGPAPLASMEEVERHFREHHARAVIAKIRNRVTIPGSPAMNSSSPRVHALTRQTWHELQRFPLPLANHLGRQLTALGVHIFKAKKNITYAGLARPRYLDRSTAPVSEAVSGMLTYIEEHPGVPRAEQWKALVALRPAPAPGEEDRREAAVAADLSWLLHEGHVIDFVGRGLEVVPRPKEEPKKETPAPSGETEAPEPGGE